MKDKINLLDQSNIVYQLNCINCDKSYIGQTKQHLSKRIQQHKRSCNILTNNSSNNTALSYHSIEFGHHFDFNKPLILHFEPKLKNRLILEMLEIKKSTKTINYQTDIENLSSIYNFIIPKLK